MQRRMDDYEANRKVPKGIKDMMDETEPPFTEDILIEEFPIDFKMIPIKQYDGKENPAGHIHGYCTWMRIRGATQAQIELKQQFLGTFVMAKTRKKDKLYLYSLKQGTEESLKSYIERFSQEMNYVEGYTDSDAVAAIREGLLEGMRRSICEIEEVQPRLEHRNLKESGRLKKEPRGLIRKNKRQKYNQRRAS
ncbi:hypothetical protein TIFTF001_056843 [Ficus carica]|uniref:Retrotransposon gag domain-containing protein n=1 Tax=Ficus carica TaxID=3494 RepID=A0AA88EQ21_FICCA|nr:hypothetical protein TIFTF001_056843 [Ficus carica]